MQKRLVFALALSLILVVSVSFVSANIFTDLWNKITGHTTATLCGNGVKDAGELCDYAADDPVNNPYGNQCSTGCWVNGAPPYWAGCRGSGANVCVDAPNVTSQYFIDHPNCIATTTCNGVFYNCNGVICPPPTAATNPPPLVNTTNQTNSTTPTCTDSDGGADYYTYGWITYTNNPKDILKEYDICSTSQILTERICVDPSNNSKNFVNYNCPNGCSNGVCLSAPVANGTNQTNINNVRLELLNECEFEAQPENANNTWYVDITPNNIYYNITLIEAGAIPSPGTYDFHPSFANYCSLSEDQQMIYAGKLQSLSEKYNFDNFSPIIAFIIWGWDYTLVNTANEAAIPFGQCQTDSDCTVGVCSSGHCVVYAQNNANQTNATGNQTQTNNITNQTTLCDGCKTDRCYPFGYRKNGDYCSVTTLSFVTQLPSGESCQNNFECGSNVCVSGQCISQNVFQRFLRWLNGLFGTA